MQQGEGRELRAAQIGLDGDTSGSTPNACHPTGGLSSRIGSQNVFVVTSGSGNYTWNDFKTENNASETGRYRMFCVWDAGGTSFYADAINFLSV
jgi:hypothetical protein